MKKLVFVGGKERPVLFNRNALADFEKIIGKNMYAADFMSIETTRALVYLGLKWGLYDKEKGIEPRPDFSILNVGDWIDGDDIVDSATVQIMSIFKDSLPKNVKAVDDTADQKK